MLINRQAHFKSNVIISIILGAALAASVLLFMPKKSLPEKIIYNKPLVLLEPIPQTVRSTQTQKEKTDTTRTHIQDRMKAYKLPDDLSRNILRVANPNEHPESNDKNRIIPKGTGIEKVNSMRKAAMAEQKTSPIESMPRLIYEEVPSNREKFNGKLQLSLKINENGQVIDHRILFNSLDCSDCLNTIIQAAYKSKWEPAIVDGKKGDYWVVKSYIFN